MIDFYDKVYRSYECDRSWFVPYSLRSWYLTFNKWVREGNCFLHDEGLRSFEKVIPPDSYYICLSKWLETEEGIEMSRFNMKFTNEENPAFRKLSATKDDLMGVKILNSADEGVQYLYDIRHIEYTYGPKGVYSFSGIYLDYE